MLKKIKLKNFMSHKNSEFELVKGVNVITGPNNSGKSAVISALQLLADLPLKEGDYMVRHGTNHASVCVETAEGDELAWHRKGSTMSLMINDDKDIRLQNNREHYLEKLHKHLKLPRVSGSDSKQDFDIHFATQKNPIFLINDPPSRAALFFASSSDAGRLFEIRDKYKEQIKDAKKEKQSTEIAWQEQNKIIDSLAPLDTLEPLLTAIQEIYKFYPKEQEAIRRGNVLVQKFLHSAKMVERFLSTYQVLQEALPSPLMEDANKLDLCHKSLTHVSDRYSTFCRNHKAFSAFRQPPDLLNINELIKNLDGLKQAKARRGKLKQVDELLVLTKKPPEIVNTDSLTLLLKNMHEQRNIISKLHSQQTHLAVVGSPPELEKDQNLSLFLKYFYEHTQKEINLKACVKHLVQLNQIPDIENLHHVERGCRDLKTTKSKLHLISHTHFALMSLQSPPHIVHLPRIENVLTNLKENLKKHKFCFQKISLEAALKSPPECDRTDALEIHIKNQNLHFKRVQTETSKLLEAETALQKWVNEHPSCPACGGDLNIEKLQASICNG